MAQLRVAAAVSTSMGLVLLTGAPAIAAEEFPSWTYREAIGGIGGASCGGDFVAMAWASRGLRVSVSDTCTDGYRGFVRVQKKNNNDVWVLVDKFADTYNDDDATYRDLRDQVVSGDRVRFQACYQDGEDGPTGNCGSFVTWTV